MNYTNSSLISYKKLSPNNSGQRNHKIDTITIHCTAGNITAQNLGDWFSKTSTKASSNYGVDFDGRIGMYVEEKNRSWCSSSSSNDNRAITIEVASDKTHPYSVSDKAYKALIRLLVDICKRNGIKKLLWKADKNLIGQIDKQNMTVHRWFSNTDCPGEYLYNMHSQIADEVNSLLEETQTKIIEDNTPSNWAKDSWEKANKLGLLDGTRPKDNVTRQELATVVVKLYEKFTN